MALRISHCWLCLLLLMCLAQVALGQDAPVTFDEGKRVPKLSYFAAVSMFEQGEYKDAVRQMKDAASAGVRTAQSRWIDAICYYTMMGEFFYETGQLSEAMDHYTAALQLASRFEQWPREVNLPDQLAFRVTNNGRIEPAPWGKTQRNLPFARLPNVALLLQGEINDQQTIRNGGIYKPAMQYPVIIGEVMRATTLAFRRRRELLGPTAAHDPLSAELVSKLTNAASVDTDWRGHYYAIQLGLAYAAAGKDHLAQKLLAKTASFQNRYDHPLTGVCLFELGRMQLKAGNYPGAVDSFYEASVNAYHSEDVGLVEESLRYGYLAHFLTNRQQVYPPLVPAAAWAKRKNLDRLECSLRLLLAESNANAGQTGEAVAQLARAEQLMRGNEMDQGRLGAQWNLTSALVHYQQGKIGLGDQALQAALQYQRRGSLWLWHIQFVDMLFQQGVFGSREGLAQYGAILREPSAVDWKTSPLESMTALATPKLDPLARYFQLALLRKKPELALEISDLTRRQRFYHSLALGGRALGFRWLLNGPTAELSQAATIQRQDILGQFPIYEGLTRGARRLQHQLKTLPLEADHEKAPQRRAALESLAQISARQEALLRQFAVRRIPCPMSFPPQRSTAEIQKLLPPKQAILAFFNTNTQVYGALITSERVEVWEVGIRAQIDVYVRNLLAAMGQHHGNQPLTPEQWEDASWRELSHGLLVRLTNGLPESDWYRQLDEVVIVPDGSLWYLPFEALITEPTFRPASQAESKPLPLDPAKTLLGNLRIRYAPTLGLAVSEQSAPQVTGHTVVQLGKISPKDDDRSPRETFERLRRRLGGVVALPEDAPSGSALAANTFERLLVFDEVQPPNGGIHAWSPLPGPGNQPRSTVDQWLALPFGAPKQVVLPGFRTAAENGLKETPSNLLGADVFLPALGLMASGSRTVVLSRWRTGGKNSYDLVSEFAEQLPYVPAAEAWQRSVLLNCEQPVVFDREPRLKFPDDHPSIDAKHPFFWSGYLVIDTGVPPQKPEVPLLGQR